LGVEAAASRPFVVALTGGIASGKSAAANEFAALGAAVLDTDVIARSVVEPGSPTLNQVIAEFGSSCVDTNGRLNRRHLRDLVFADFAKRRRLEAILHPAIHQELARQSAAAVGPYQIHVIPLLAEGGRASDYQHRLVVDCDEHLQHKRLMHRDQSTELQARQALAAQATREQRLAIATDVIENNSTLDNLQKQVRDRHQQYLKLAAQHRT
jgi:dephospho-CoA kinase